MDGVLNTEADIDSALLPVSGVNMEATVDLNKLSSELEVEYTTMSRLQQEITFKVHFGRSDRVAEAEILLRMTEFPQAYFHAHSQLAYMAYLTPEPVLIFENKFEAFGLLYKSFFHGRLKSTDGYAKFDVETNNFEMTNAVSYTIIDRSHYEAEVSSYYKA